jgi:hypothetical protein
MRGWKTGEAEIQQLLADGHLQRVVGGKMNGEQLLLRAERTLSTASAIVATDPESAYVLAYDATRYACISTPREGSSQPPGSCCRLSPCSDPAKARRRMGFVLATGPYDRKTTTPPSADSQGPAELVQTGQIACRGSPPGDADCGFILFRLGRSSSLIEARSLLHPPSATVGHPHAQWQVRPAPTVDRAQWGTTCSADRRVRTRAPNP